MSNCTAPLSTLDPAGPSASSVASLWWIMLSGTVVILFGVMAAAIFALKRNRPGRNLSERAMLAGGGLAFPAVTLMTLLIYSLVLSDGIGDDDREPWRVDAVNRQWAWEFTHLDAPDGPTRTVNSMSIPAPRTVEVRVMSENIIHSFWAPRLGGEIDAIPGKTNTIRLHADRPGVFAGTCAEFCGAGHAQMGIDVHAFATEGELMAALRQEEADRR